MVLGPGAPLAPLRRVSQLLDVLGRVLAYSYAGYFLWMTEPSAARAKTSRKPLPQATTAGGDPTVTLSTWRTQPASGGCKVAPSHHFCQRAASWPMTYMS